MKSYLRGLILSVGIAIFLPLFTQVAPAGEIAVESGQKIAFLGDSITAGGARSGGYCRMVIDGLKNEGIEVSGIFAGKSGHKSNDMLARLDADVISKKPAWMTLSCGVNDVWHFKLRLGKRTFKGVSLEDYKKNITAIIDKAQAAGIKVMILTSTMIGEDPARELNQNLKPYNEFLRKIAKEKKCLLADLDKDMRKALKAMPDVKGRTIIFGERHNKGNIKNKLTTDGCHMNALGNKMMGTGILKTFGVPEARIAAFAKEWPPKRGPRVKKVKAPTKHPAAARSELNNPFFAFDNGIGRGRLTPEQQAKTLKKLGYAGIGYTGVRDLPRRIKAFKDCGLRVFNLYVGCNPSNKKRPYDPKLIDAMKQLEGTGAMLWLTVHGKTDDKRAAAVIRELADKAAKHGVKIALYPHFGYYIATAPQAIRLVKKVDRKNVGMTINLCHELKSGNGPKLPEIIKASAPHLFQVSINGADHKGGWNKLIRPLGDGEFDVPGFLKTLKQAGYTGPIGLQCYAVKGDQVKNLARSMAAWKIYKKKFAARKK
jgi:sugar phosphate isomerase/epimerase/lysophospholipase L1-like esterase